MRARLQALQQAARPLEPDAEERAALTHNVLRYAETLLERIPRAPAFVTTEDRGLGLLDAPITEDPVDIHTALALLGEHVDRPGIHPVSPGFLGYIPGGGLYFAALGDYLAAVANRYAGVFFASPGAVRMEQMLVRWLAGVVGYPDTTAGDLTSGGSIANLSAIAAARDACGLKARDVERSVVYLSKQTHHCIEKALRIAGLSECVKRYIPLDGRYRMRADALAAAVAADRQGGLIPWLVVASAGTTDVGAVDPLTDIAAIARTHRLWLHIDGAYGAIFVLCEEGKKILAGLDRSDSLVLDPHKGLFLPYGTGAVLVKDGQKLLQAHYYRDVPYMQDSLAAREELSPADLSPELTRHFRGLRLWLSLKLAGVAAFRAALEEKLLLARYFYETIRTIPGFEAGPAPDLSVVTFRYVPERGDPEAFNRKLAQAVQEDGRFFFSTTLLDGRFTLRFAILCFRTHLETIDLAIDILREKAAAITREFQQDFK
jgi:glutamate/tyrosine decarboxylase-like PLP-dependent enzyme